MIRLRGAGVRYGETWVFRNLDLDLPKGLTTAVLGPNGRGKTTLIKAAVGLLPLDEGSREAPELIGYVPQAGASAPYSVLDMVVMGRLRQLSLFSAPSRDDYALARMALERTGMTGFAGHRFDTLSGGERQLVLLARALATGAETLVLDEPAAALDLANQDRLLAILNDIRRGGRHTTLFSTHAPQHAFHAADRACLLVGEEERSIGEVDTILTEAALQRLYGLPIRRLTVGWVGGAAQAAVPLFGAGDPDISNNQKGKLHDGEVHG